MVHALDWLIGLLNGTIAKVNFDWHNLVLDRRVDGFVRFNILALSQCDGEVDGPIRFARRLFIIRDKRMGTE